MARVGHDDAWRRRLLILRSWCRLALQQALRRILLKSPLQTKRAVKWQLESGAGRRNVRGGWIFEQRVT